MKSEIIPENEKLYQCPECDVHYDDEATAKRCEAWCKKHQSRNLEITRHSAEAGRQ